MTGKDTEDVVDGAFDFSGGARKDDAHHADGPHLVRLDPDVAAAFPTAESVNEALRALAAIIVRHSASARGG